MGLKKQTIEALGGLTSSQISTDSLSLEVVEGPHQGKCLSIQKEIVRIGRAQWCELDLPDDLWVSNAHCELWLEEGGLRVRDLKSRNGIQLNGLQVFDALFPPDARLKVGQSVMSLKASEAEQTQIPILYHDESETLLGKSPAMRKIFSMLSRLKNRKIPVLLRGETGVGKSSIARALHLQGEKPQAPFVTVNCGALPSSLIEASLFGYEKGAFTGADKKHRGFFEQAHGGTLFLDEIAEIPLELQPKLLDVLERQVIRKIGSEKEERVDFRLLCATHQDLQEACKAGRFREDLYYRLSVIELEIPPLRERREDIPLLTEAILKEVCPERSLSLSAQARKSMRDELWPGNIRQLYNTLTRAVTFLEGDTVEAEDLLLPNSAKKENAPVPVHISVEDKPLDQELSEEVLPLFPLSSHDPPISLKDILKDTERFVLAKALEETDMSAPKAAKLLQLSESWLYSRIKLHGLTSKRATTYKKKS